MLPTAGLALMLLAASDCTTAKDCFEKGKRLLARADVEPSALARALHARCPDDVLEPADSNAEPKKAVRSEVDERVAAAGLTCEAAASIDVEAVRRRLLRSAQALLEKGCNLGHKAACEKAVGWAIGANDCLTAPVCLLAGKQIIVGTEVNEAMGESLYGRGCKLGGVQSCVALARRRIPGLEAVGKNAPEKLEHLCLGGQEEACLGLATATKADAKAHAAALARAKKAAAQECAASKAPYCSVVGALLRVECDEGAEDSCRDRRKQAETACRSQSIEGCAALVEDWDGGRLDASQMESVAALAASLCEPKDRCAIRKRGEKRPKCDCEHIRRALHVQRYGPALPEAVSDGDACARDVGCAFYAVVTTQSPGPSASASGDSAEPALRALGY